MTGFTLLYLTAAPSVAGRHHFYGRKMVDALRQQGADPIVCHYVTSSEGEPIPPEAGQDAIDVEAAYRMRPDVVYLEGGLQIGTDRRWRFPREPLEDLIHGGSVVVIADADLNAAVQYKQVYEDAASLLGARYVYRPEEDWEPVHLADEAAGYGGSHRSIVVDPAEMYGVSKWLYPAYDGVSHVRVDLPVLLDCHDSILATGNRNSTGTMQGDRWIDRVAISPWATVRGLGNGYVAFIAGAVSHDGITDLFPDNIKWMSNLLDLLVAEARQEAQRKSARPDMEDGIPDDVYLDPDRPYSNVLALHRLLRSLRGGIFWYEQHMSSKVLEVLSDGIDRKSVRSISLLSGPSAITERTQKVFATFAEEMRNLGIATSWGVLTANEARDIHVRVIFDQNGAWQLPPLNLLLKGTVDSIRRSDMERTRLDTAFGRATPIAEVQLQS